MRFDRHELAGSFGDIGTDLPLLIGMIAAAGLDAGRVFLVFGSLQILSGIYYRLPMPMQPLKAMAVIVIAGKLSPGTIHGGGVAIGVTMLALTATGLLARVAALFPLAVVRGIQFGLGLSLALLAVRSYIWPSGVMGWYAAAGGFFIMLILWQNRRLPAGLVLVGAAVLYGALIQNAPTALATNWRADWLTFQLPAPTDIATGFLLLALPQLPLSLANSVVATRQTCADLFPDRDVSIRKIGVTYGVANLVSASFGGVPVCHGSGGLVGHHNFGARTGASVVIYGAIFVIAALLFGHRAEDVLALFPLSVLGVILTFEAFGLMRLARLTEPAKWAQFVTLATGFVCAMAPHGFLVGSVTGITLYHAPNLWRKVQP